MAEMRNILGVYMVTSYKHLYVDILKPFIWIFQLPHPHFLVVFENYCLQEVLENKLKNGNQFGWNEEFVYV